MPLLTPEKIDECAKAFMKAEDRSKDQPDWEPMGMIYVQVGHLMEDLDAVMDANMPAINAAIRDPVKDNATKQQKARALTHILGARYLEKV